ncbi:hypothetical protein [Streptomyces sp. NPDC001307]|uniref:hypothetical protein n=1 Tax=Streptomyces sp. NPDC001307 TaxID=3364560 RepID=UPI0036BE5863
MLADGDITAQGRVTFIQAPTDFDVAIIGGTGSYRRATGWLHGHSVNGTDTQVTLHIYPYPVWH